MVCLLDGHLLGRDLCIVFRAFPDIILELLNLLLKCINLDSLVLNLSLVLMRHPLHLFLEELILSFHLSICLMYLERFLNLLLHLKAVLLQLCNMLILGLLPFPAFLHSRFELLLQMFDLILMSLPHALNLLLE